MRFLRTLMAAVLVVNTVTPPAPAEPAPDRSWIEFDYGLPCLPASSSW